MQEVDFIAVVVTYNRVKMLERCITALLSQTVPCGILIVDNASSDGTETYANKLIGQYKNIHYENTGNNMGGAGGFNYGMRWSVEHGYKYIWLMDDDCIPYPDTLEKLVEADRKLQKDYGWLTSVVLWKDGTECRMNRPKLKKNTTPVQEGIILAVQASFVSLFLPSTTVRKAGLPIKEFFIWGDDIEYTRRIAVRMNMPCFVVSQSKVVHAMESNGGSNIATDVPERIDRYKYAFRNEGFLYRQEGLSGWLYYFSKVGYNMCRIAFVSKDNRLKRLFLLLESSLDGLHFNPKIENVPIARRTEKY